MTAKSTDWRPGPTVCRCCLSDGCYKDISTEYFWMGKREVYAEMLSETLSLTIAYSQSGGPNSNSRLICEACIARLRDASDFRRQVLECEKTFMHHLDPGSSTAALDLEVPLVETLGGGDVKLEVVKLEKQLSDDDDFGDTEFLDDDDDDLDDQPLMNLATKIPKKESVDLMDLLDNAKVTEKRKSSTKTKTSPSKKPKIVKREVKPTPSKAQPKPEKKKKEKNDPNLVAKWNAEVLVKYSTVYPFKLPEEHMVCVFCGETYPDPAVFRAHMDDEHPIFQVRNAFHHCSEGFIKVDCTRIQCRLCCANSSFTTLEEIARHLRDEHSKSIDMNNSLGLQPFKLENNKFLCAMCTAKFPCLRQLSRHTQSHFLRYTCEACGKSYATVTALSSHKRYSHINNMRICRKCKNTFSTIEEKRVHIATSPKCWCHLCNHCGERFMTWNLKQNHLSEVHMLQKKNHVCTECGEVFGDRKKYRVHFKLTHTDDAYVCSCCGMKFETKKILEEHRVSHTMEKLFPCTVCNKAFPRKKNLNQHLWIHREEKRFECKPCNKKFNQKISWKTHVKSYHPEMLSTYLLS